MLIWVTFVSNHLANTYVGKLETLKNGKKEVGEMRKGSECGMSFEDWSDIEIGDKIQAYEEIREKRRL